MSTFGLVAALVGDGLWDVASWLTLGAPVVVTLRYAPIAPKRWRRRGEQAERSAA